MQKLRKAVCLAAVLVILAAMTGCCKRHSGNEGGGPGGPDDSKFTTGSTSDGAGTGNATTDTIRPLRDGSGMASPPPSTGTFPGTTTTR